MAGKRLIEFYGTECVHCKEMDPIREKVEKDIGVKITRLEVWHNSENARLLQRKSTYRENFMKLIGAVTRLHKKLVLIL